MTLGIDNHAQLCWIKPSGGELIEFQFMPDEIRDSKSANYANTEIIGRSHPIKGYASSGARTLSFTLKFYQMSEGDAVSPFKNITKLRALLYPNYGNGIAPPPICHIKAGKVQMQGVLTSFDATYRYPWEKDASPMYAEVSLTFEETGTMPFSMQDVINMVDWGYSGDV